MRNITELRTGLAWSELRQTYAIVMLYEDSRTFGVWFANGDLYIYDSDAECLIDPLRASDLGRAFELFSGWYNCGDMLQ
jgi:hypothetical protein